MYSRRWLGLNASNVASALRFFFSAARKSTGGSGAGRGADRLRGPADFTPSSFNFIALRISGSSCFFGGISASRVILPKLPMPSRGTPSPTTSACFQNPNEACCLNAAMPHRMPPACMKVGMPHFRVSSTCGQASWTMARSFSRIGRANSADWTM